ncbi:hypothetical protein EV189_3251 [Motilibacter rhizosphaerae]|uniref:Neocarzinostatin family protein n=1 Tax=Motilibacter rhizosphaerae TaxID=598652 RepID=A0A4Q7NHD0_9ACTN|nr:hypothetical protein [Motilibacter rhizosphaerae]RZS82856.1 hypothetical protein EV189_3251 [Motilibacter rhizosphaerae]
MRTSSRAGLALALPLALAGTAAAALPAAALVAGPGPATTVQGIGLSTTSVTLRGTQVRLVTVTVHLADPAGVRPREAAVGEERSATCPCARVEPLRRSLSLGSRTVVLRRSAGTPTDGTWSGTFPVSAQDTGAWTVTEVIGGTIDTRAQGFPSGTGWVSTHDVTTTPPPTLKVTGRTPLVLTARGRSPRKDTLQVTGTARVGGRPAAGLLLSVRALQCGDIEGPGGVLRRVRTDRAGTFSTVVSSPAFAVDLGVCVTYGPTGTSSSTAVSASAGA